MNIETVYTLLNILQVSILTFVLWRLVLRMKTGSFTMVSVFYLYALILFLLSDIYWLVHGLLRPETRIPFGANEIGEIGIYLMFSSLLNAVFKKEERFKELLGATLLAGIFSLADIALWIGWTGEWVKDILSGLAFGYFACTTIRSLIISKAFDKKRLSVLGVMAFVLLGLQGMIFVIPEAIGNILDIVCYCIMFAGMIWLFVFCIKTVRKAYSSSNGNDSDENIKKKSLAVSFLLSLWIHNALYMSNEYVYTVIFIIVSFNILIMYFSVAIYEDGAFCKEGVFK